MRRAAFALALGVSLASGPARARPAGPGAEPAAVFPLASDLDSDLPAKAITNELSRLVLDGPDFALNTLGSPLLSAAKEARCKLGGGSGLLPDESTFDRPCLARLGRRVGAAQFFWGFVRADSRGRPVVRLHLFREGAGDRVAELIYDEDARGRVAARLYAKLVRPGEVGDVTLSGDASGELAVDGRPEGPYAPGIELTLSTGDHQFEVRQGQRVVARGRALVMQGGRVEARLEPVAAPVPAPLAPFVDPPRVTVRPRASAWPWVLGGTAIVGLAGTGAFWALRGAAKGDAEGPCSGAVCPPRARADIERADRYGVLAGVSLGVGLAAGAGLTAYVLTAKREPRVVGGVAPVAGGGAALSVWGSF
jgi:hypothetical protein